MPAPLHHRDGTLEVRVTSIAARRTTGCSASRSRSPETSGSSTRAATSRSAWSPMRPGSPAPAVGHHPPGFPAPGDVHRAGAGRRRRRRRRAVLESVRPAAGRRAHHRRGLPARVRPGLRDGDGRRASAAAPGCELAGLGVPLGAGGDGSNPVAEGLMPAGGAGDDAPAPRFSPALAVQKHPGSAVAVSLVAGTGSGPWWLAIQREFGPIYLEQVGLAVDQRGTGSGPSPCSSTARSACSGCPRRSTTSRSLTRWTARGSRSTRRAGKIDVAGFAVTADIAGSTLAGGLRKFTPAAGGVEYLGMLLARFGVYGISVYGGFGQVGPPNDRYVSPASSSARSTGRSAGRRRSSSPGSAAASASTAASSCRPTCRSSATTR